MTYNNLESHNIEWKRAWHDDYLKWVCGFANERGGRIHIGKDESIPRNPLIAEICYKVGYIDSWGRGVEKIAEACRESGLPPPQFTERSGGILVELRRAPVKTPVKLGNELGNAPKTVSEGAGDKFGMISERIRNDFGKELAKAFEVICQHPEFTARQIAAELGKTQRTVENYLAKLKSAGFVRRKGPKLGGHWEVSDV